MSNWIEDIANYLRDAGYRGGRTFALEMPESVSEGAVIVPPQSGLYSTRDLPTYYRGEFLVVVRTKDVSQLMTLAAEAVQLLTLENSILGGTKIVTCYCNNTPTPFPKNDAGTYEASVEMCVVLIDQRPYTPPGTPPSVIHSEVITVFYDDERDSIFVSAWPMPFPDRSLVASAAGDLVSIKIANLNVPVITGKHYESFRNQAGDSFASAALVVQYLDVEFAQHDRSEGGGGTSELELEAAGAISGQRVVCEDTDGTAFYPDISVAVHAELVVGISKHAAADGDDLAVQYEGEMVEGSWNWTPGPIFVGANGTLTQTPPEAAWIRQVGVAVAPTKIVVGLRPAFMTP